MVTVSLGMIHPFTGLCCPLLEWLRVQGQHQAGVQQEGPTGTFRTNFRILESSCKAACRLGSSSLFCRSFSSQD